jgi:hypothetical protein
MLPLIKSLDQFQLDERETGKPNMKRVYVRIKPKAAPARTASRRQKKTDKS